MQGAQQTNAARRVRPVNDLVELVDIDGFDVTDSVWDVAWLDDLREVPADAVWPRLMTAPHPDAVGSLGGEFEVWCRVERDAVLRWWQRLLVRRLLEVDAQGRLVWRVLLLTLARQLGKSWLLVLILAWRLHQGPRFGTPQRLLHMSIQMRNVRDVMEAELDFAAAHPDLYATLDNNNDTSIELLADRSRWVRIVRGNSRTGGAYGQSAVAVGVVDEAWSIPASVVDDSLEPTLVSGVQSQLLLISTAHRMATALMLDRRMAALDDLALVLDPVLLVEWSAPRHFAVDDRDGWRMASPWWDTDREVMIRMKVQRALSGFASEDDDEPDPVESVRAQWFNQWPVKLTSRRRIEPLIDMEMWSMLHVDAGVPVRLWVAVADNFGRGAAVAVVAVIGDGQFEVDGWTCGDRNEALADARELLSERELPGELIVEPALATIAPRATHAVPADVRFGMPLLRELVESGRVVHDVTPELDRQLAECKVRSVQGGLALAKTDRSDLVRATALAVRAAVVYKPRPGIN